MKIPIRPIRPIRPMSFISLRRPLRPVLLLLTAAALMTACNYSEDVDLFTLSVQLVYPENTVQPYEGAPVELRATGRNAVFIDSTDATGMVRFRVTPGIYEASTSAQFVDSTGTTWWRYLFNGMRSMIVVSPDSLNQVTIELKSSRKRVVH